MKINQYKIALPILLLWASCGGGKNPTEPGGQKNTAPSPVHGYILQASDVENSIEVNGSILAWEEVQLMAEIAGRIEQISFTEGTAVKKGQLLVKINDADLRARFLQVASKLSLEEKSITRLSKLISSGGVSQQEYDETEARIEDLKGEKSFLQSQLDKTEIRAPWDGKIGIRSVSEGAVVSMGTTIATLRQVNPVKVEFKIPERFAALVQKGNVFTLRTDYLANETIKGTVVMTEPGIDPATRTLLLRGKIDNKSEKLIPGTSARISLMLDSIRNAFMVPDKAIKPVIRGKEIIVVRNGIAKIIPVEMGLRISNKLQIMGDIQVGDTIITSGIMQLKEGMPVQITKIENGR